LAVVKEARGGNVKGKIPLRSRPHVRLLRNRLPTCGDNGGALAAETCGATAEMKIKVISTVNRKGERRLRGKKSEFRPRGRKEKRAER